MSGPGNAQLVWRGVVPLANAEMLALLYGVSTRSVRRWCVPVEHEPRAGRRRGLGGVAWYDAIAAADTLARVSPRATRTGVGLRVVAARRSTSH